MADAPTPLDEATRLSIILKAIEFAGPGATEQKVVGEVKRISQHFAPGSTAQLTLTGSKQIHGTIIGVDQEKTSKRGIVFLATRPHPKWNPEGKEFVRSVILESNESARDQMNQIAKSIGHKVTLTVVVTEGEEGKNRDFRHADIGGVDEAYNPADPRYIPSYAKLDVNKMARGPQA